MDPDRPLSPTRLEDWVTSPFSYFLKHVLKVTIFEDVELEVQINPMQRGNLVHKILEDYVREVADEGQPPSSDRLLELAEGAFTEFANPVWLAHVWDRTQARIRQDLRQVFDADHKTADEGWSYLAAEASFGPEDTDTHPPVELTLDDGSSIYFRGKVDRIDQHDDGRLKVIDYKTGKAKRYQELKKHRTAEGSRFQLPVYGLFARTLARKPASDVVAQYWFISSDGGFATIGYEVSEDVIAQLREDASLIISAIRGGVFPMRPESTPFTSFTNLMGAQEAKQQWLRVQNAPELAPYAELLKVEK
nr:PD-(D/E)XK nuclease family protein [Arthrobacter roseus]